METLCICFKFTQHPLLHVEEEHMGNVTIVTLAAAVDLGGLGLIL